ncbi:MAG: papain-like cysteine protease family protein [Clostridium sp.]
MLKKISTCCLAVLFVFLINSQITNATSLNINGEVQEKTNWCWSATTKSVSDYLGGAGLSQTQIVTSVKGSAINEGASPTEQKTALNKDGINTTYVNGRISYDSIKNMISGWYSPILAHIAWTSGGAHAVVIYGYTEGAYNYISYMDPWGPNSRWNSCDVYYFNGNNSFSWARTYYQNY